jgi:hypothetical protein
MPTRPAYAADPLLDLLAPFWQGLLGACVALTLVVAAARLARRGRSRMRTALLISGGAVIGLALIAVMMSH